MSAVNYIDKAREAMIYFHNQSARFSNYDISFDDLLVKINRDKAANVTPFLNNFGRSLAASELSAADIKNIMENLAKQGQGRIPSDANVFFQSLISEVQNISWVQVVKETAGDIADGVQAFGENVNFTLKGLNAIFPFIVIGGLAYIAITRIKKVA